jgi:metal-dependent amidase/aminoacylase/carboxypeptidase family protein
MAVLTSSQSGDLIALSRDIHRHPELAYQERHAVADIAALLGHGCGHNLIAISNVGAFLVAAASAKRLEVGVALIGTPAEENGGGKIDLLAAGVFDDSIAVMSSHRASGAWVVSGTGLGVVM